MSDSRRALVGFHLLVVGAVTLLAGAGCAGTVAVPDPTPTGAAAQICPGVLADLPDQVLDQDRRRVDPGRFSAAWGKPAIVLRCGVTAPPGLTATSECLEVNGVGWFTEPAQGGIIFTTIGRPALVELSVPAHYAPEPGALVDVAEAVAAHDPVSAPCR